MVAILIRLGLRPTIPGNTCRFCLTAPEDSMARTWACARRWRIWGRPWRRILAERFRTERAFWQKPKVARRFKSRRKFLGSAAEGAADPSYKLAGPQERRGILRF